MYLPVEQLYVVMCKIQEVESGCVDITLETRQYTTPSFVASFGMWQSAEVAEIWEKGSIDLSRQEGKQVTWG